MNIEINSRTNFDNLSLTNMHLLRAKIFRDKKSWDVSVIGGMEIDGYDALNPYYMILQNESRDHAWGCWRMLPTTGPNMLADTFPELLAGAPAPCSDDIWELSRFVITHHDGRSYSFSEQSLMAIKAVIDFGVERKLRQFVTVTTVGVEKLLIRLGLSVRRLGPAAKIGVERAVALSIDLNEKTLSALAQIEHQPNLSN